MEANTHTSTHTQSPYLNSLSTYQLITTRLLEFGTHTHENGQSNTEENDEPTQQSDTHTHIHTYTHTNTLNTNYSPPLMLGTYSANILLSTLEQILTEIEKLHTLKNEIIKSRTNNGSEKWFNLPKTYQQTEIGQNFHTLQSKTLHILLIKIRQYHRNLMNFLDEFDNYIKSSKNELNTAQNNLTNALYELAWFNRRIEEEESFETPLWDSLQKEMISENVYVQQSSNSSMFVKKEDDTHQFIINWLNFDLMERMKAKENLDSVKRQREVAEQHLQVLVNKEEEFNKCFQELEKFTHQVQNICTIDTLQTIEFPPKAKSLPNPLLNVYSRLFGYRQLMADEQCVITVENLTANNEGNSNYNQIDQFYDSTNNTIYQPHTEHVVITLNKEEDTPLPTGTMAQALLPFPLKISFRYLPTLDIITVHTEALKNFGPQKNLFLLSALFDDDLDDYGDHSPNPSNYNNELPSDGLLDPTKMSFGKAYRWAQSLASMKYGISLSYVKQIPEEINVQNLIKRIRHKTTLRLWTLFQIELLKSKPNNPLLSRLPPFPPSSLKIVYCNSSNSTDYTSAAPLHIWPDQIEIDDLVYLKIAIKYVPSELIAFIAIPLNEKPAKFRLILDGPPDENFNAHIDLSETEKQIYTSSHSTHTPLKASNTIIKDNHLSHYQYYPLKELEDSVNEKLVEQFGGMEGPHRFSMLAIQMTYLRVGFEKFVKGDELNSEGEESLSPNSENR